MRSTQRAVALRVSSGRTFALRWPASRDALAALAFARLHEKDLDGEAAR
jgi:hypothetical protein